MGTEEVVFDHSKNTTQLEDGEGRKFLEQDGNVFTNAEFQRHAVQTGTDIDGNPVYDAGGKWVPEPQHLPDYHTEVAVDRVTKILEYLYERRQEEAGVYAALDIFAREAIGRARLKDKSFNKLKGELGAMKRELKKYEKIKKLASVKAEMAKLEEGIAEDGK